MGSGCRRRGGGARARLADRPRCEGRYLPSEAPTDSDFEAGERSALSVAELINIWPDARRPPTAATWCSTRPGRASSRSTRRPPSREIEFNLLNLFYALEWAIFAGFAIYLWYRLVRDVVEREADGARP